MTEPAIRIAEAVFRWRAAQAPTLDIPALTVAAGEQVFINGPSGSGKTTLLNLLGGVSVPQSGTVEVLGRVLTALTGAARDAFRGDHVGFIFQQFNLVPYLDVVENVLLPCRFSALRRARAGEAAGGSEAEARRLLGHMGLAGGVIDGHRVSELSVGQQQRVAAARALIGRPDLVIADEPTSSLDADAQAAFIDLLFAAIQATGASLVFVSHDRRLEGRFGRSLALAEINRAPRTPAGASDP